MADNQQDSGGLAEISLRKLKDPKKRAFIDAYQEIGTIAGAAENCGVERRNHYNWLANDSSYRYVFKTSLQMVRDRAEDTLIDLMINGIEEPIYHQGQLVGHKKKVFPAVALSWLKARFPEDYGGEKAEVNVGIQNNVTVPDASEIVGKLIVEYPHLIDVLHNLDSSEIEEE